MGILSTSKCKLVVSAVTLFSFISVNVQFPCTHAQESKISLRLISDFLDSVHDFSVYQHLMNLDGGKYTCRGENLKNIEPIKAAVQTCSSKTDSSDSCAVSCILEELKLVSRNDNDYAIDTDAVSSFLKKTMPAKLNTEFQKAARFCAKKYLKDGSAQDCGKMNKVIHCLQVITVQICDMSMADQAASKPTVSKDTSSEVGDEDKKSRR